MLGILELQDNGGGGYFFLFFCLGIEGSMHFANIINIVTLQIGLLYRL